MAKSTTGQRIRTLLDKLKADFPRRKAAAEKLMKQHGMDQSLELKFMPPEKVQSIPSFSNNKTYPVTPFLKARFEYAGSIDYAGEIWLSVTQMGQWMRKKAVRSYHKALRENWCESAPMLFRDEQLSLLEVTVGVPQNLTYLVWCRDNVEPQIWSYQGFDSHKFANLEEYLTWCLNRE
jgi:hypothetical protein